MTSQTPSTRCTVVAYAVTILADRGYGLFCLAYVAMYNWSVEAKQVYLGLTAYDHLMLNCQVPQVRNRNLSTNPQGILDFFLSYRRARRLM